VFVVEKLVVSWMGKKFLAFCGGTLWFIAMITSTFHLSAA
jgi:hypothetical protein